MFNFWSKNAYKYSSQIFIIMRIKQIRTEIRKPRFCIHYSFLKKSKLIKITFKKREVIRQEITTHWKEKCLKRERLQIINNS